MWPQRVSNPSAGCDASPWGAAVGAAIGLIGNEMQSDKNGGAGASTTSKEPWALATPWLANNLLLGQQMQGDYLAQPISAKQQQATDNQYALSDYMRGAVPSLLGQMQAQPLGYDKTNPTAKAKAFDWSLAGTGGVNGLNQGSLAAAQDPAKVAKVAAPADFVNQSDTLTGANMGNLASNLGMQSAAGGLLGTGKYGSFTYGMAMPQPGTQQYRDMSEYFANGGGDPNNFYGRGGQQGYGGLLANMWGGDGNSDGGDAAASAAASAGSAGNSVSI